MATAIRFGAQKPRQAFEYKCGDCTGNFIFNDEYDSFPDNCPLCGEVFDETKDETVKGGA